MLSLASRAARGSSARVAFAATRALNTKVPVEEVKAKYLKTEESEPTRRAFTYFMVGASGFAYTSALKSSVTSFLSTMSASADVLAMSSVEVDLNSINKGTTVVVKWRGKPLFIRHRTAGDIEKADATDHLSLVDPQHDDERVTKKDWLIVLGVCTHLGCVPIDGEGDYGGWFCPCHGSHYDTSGRIRKGPAPLNLEVPPYRFTEEDTVVVG